ncbi:MAG: VanZ family protein [Thermoanaerobaculia bacterium]
MGLPEDVNPASRATLFRTPLERRLWLAVGITVSLLLAALYPLQFVLDALRARNLLRPTIAALFLLCAVAVVGALAWHRAPRAAWIVVALAGAVYGALALAMEVPQERLHLVEYGVLALLLRAAIAESVARRPAGDRVSNIDVWALGAATAIGWIDEAVQGILPNRIYDLRDVAFNALAALLALGAAAVVRKAMREPEHIREQGVR